MPSSPFVDPSPIFKARTVASSNISLSLACHPLSLTYRDPCNYVASTQNIHVLENAFGHASDLVSVPGMRTQAPEGGKGGLPWAQLPRGSDLIYPFIFPRECGRGRGMGGGGERPRGLKNQTFFKFPTAWFPLPHSPFPCRQQG